MQRYSKFIELGVGFLLILGLGSLIFIALNASDYGQGGSGPHVVMSANFDNVSGLRVRAPVRIAGVRIGEVKEIALDAQTYRAHVVLDIRTDAQHIPIDSQARILTEGLLGSKYISIVPGISNQFLMSGEVIQRTTSAMVLEDLIGKLVFNLSQ